MSFDQRSLRNALGHFATGVTVLTYEVDGIRYGATVNAFTAVSLDPPLIQVSLDRRSKASEFLHSHRFVVNVLSASQCDIALNFAGKPKPECNIAWDESSDTAPRLAGTSAWFDCTPWRCYDGGDHILVLGEVKSLELTGSEPLLFFGGRFRSVGGFPDALVGPTYVPDPGWFGESEQFLFPSEYVERLQEDRQSN